SILSIMHEVRLQFLKHLGFKSEVDIDENVGLIVADVAVQYKAESFHGDELEIRVAVQDFNKYGFDMLYQLINVRSGSEVAVGKTGIVCMDYSIKKVAPAPHDLLKRIRGNL
ncbi:MAG: thioesterase family protein, partial [Bacteroidota bacterium]